MPAPIDPSLYELLEVSQAASSQEIEGAYQRVFGLVAPDSLAVYAMLDEAEVEALRHQVQEAYETLRDTTRRAAYDAALGDIRRRAAGPNQRLRPLPAATLDLPELAPQASLDVSSARSAGPPASVSFSAAVGASGASAWPVVQPQGPSARVASQLRGAPSASGAPSFGTPAQPARARQGLRPQGGRKLLRPTLGLEYTEALEVTGTLLRSIRESAQASLDDVSEITKISKRYLAALEADDCGNLPATVYVRGFVSEYARALGLEPQAVAKSYMSQYQRHCAKSGG